MTTDTITEQPVVETPPVEPAPVEVAAPEVEQVPADAGVLDVAEDTVTLDALLERHPELRSDFDERIKVRENAAAQRREAQMRREAGTREQTRAQVQRYLDNVVAQPLRQLGATDEEIAAMTRDTSRLDFMYALARENAGTEIARELPDALLREYALPAEAKLAAVEARDQLVTLADGTQVPNYDAYVRTLVDAAVDLRVKERTAELERETNAKVARLVAAELKAKAIESAPKVEAPPIPPQGQPAGSGGVQINSMSDADGAFGRGAISVEQYRQYRTQFGVGLTPGGR